MKKMMKMKKEKKEKKKKEKKEKMKKEELLFCLLLLLLGLLGTAALAPPAHGETINFIESSIFFNGFDKEDFDDMNKDLGAAFAFSTNSGGSSLENCGESKQAYSLESPTPLTLLASLRNTLVKIKANLRASPLVDS